MGYLTLQPIKCLHMLALTTLGTTSTEDACISLVLVKILSTCTYTYILDQCMPIYVKTVAIPPQWYQVIQSIVAPTHIV